MFSATRDALMAARTSAKHQVLERKDPHHPPFEQNIRDINNVVEAIRKVLSQETRGQTPIV